MSTFETLPTEIIEEIAQYLDFLDGGPTEHERRLFPRDDLLSLASASRRMREIFFDDTWVKEHVMNFTVSSLEKTVQHIALSMRSKVKYVPLVEAYTR